MFRFWITIDSPPVRTSSISSESFALALESATFFMDAFTFLLTILVYLSKMVNRMIRTVFFADVLGFSNMSVEEGAVAAVDALSDLATLLSEEHVVARYLNRFAWEARYALSDSVFLTGESPVKVCVAAAEFFFNLAYYNTSRECPVLLRGAIAEGEVRYTPSIFPTATSNLVGAAVVEAVTLERLELRGPRLFVTER